MTTLTYNLSRGQAANQLGVSTRTVDRYVKSGKLSYKKVANKVILATEEINDLQLEFDLLHQQENNETSVTKERTIPLKNELRTQAAATGAQIGGNAVGEFVEILTKKDQAIEEKNQLIYILQRKIGELETTMQHMIALPDHSQEKEELTQAMQQLTVEKQHLEHQVKREKIWNVIYIGLVLIAAVMIMVFTFV